MEVVATKKRSGSKPEDEHLVVLRAIWNEMKALNSRIDATNQRLDAVRADAKTEHDELQRTLTDEDHRLWRRQVESEVRLSTTLTQLHAGVTDLGSLIRESRDEARADRVEMRLRLDRLERQAGVGRP